MLTEAEAAAKRCPMSFPAADGINAGGFVEPTYGPAPSFANYQMGAARNCAPMFCIGSACMAWRVGEAAVPAYPGAVHATDSNGKVLYRAGTERPAIPAKGFCGMAGKL